MTKTRIVNGILSGMLALYAVFIFVVTKYPRLTNNAPLPYDAIFNNQPVLSVLLMLMWMVAVWKSKEKHA